MIDRIEPGRAVGRLRLGMTREEVLSVCGTPVRERGPRPEDLCILDFGPISVGLDNGMANMLIVQEAGAGETADGIRVGASWGQLLQTRGEPTYDAEESGSWVDASEKGIWYDIRRPLREGEETLDPPFGEEHLFVSDPEHAFIRRIFVMLPQ